LVLAINDAQHAKTSTSSQIPLAVNHALPAFGEIHRMAIILVLNAMKHAESVTALLITTALVVRMIEFTAM
jgi:hypothetical protein